MAAVARQAAHSGVRAAICAMARLEVGEATAGRLSKELRGKTRWPGRSILHGTFATPRTVRTCLQLVLLTQPRRSALNAGYVPQNPRAVG